MKNKTFNDFWAEFLQVTFHEGHPELWPSRERKAKWLVDRLNLKNEARILDLGCGDGLIDIWLSRMGHHVTAIDRSETVLEIAKNKDDTRRVRFIAADLRGIEFAESSFDAVFVIETLGLLSLSEDQDLFGKISNWLLPGGKLIVDCPQVVDVSNSWTKQFADGEVRCHSSFDFNSRLQQIDFRFKTQSGEDFCLNDPIRGDATGITRYIYPKDELARMLKEANFSVEETFHYYEKDYYALVGTKIADE